MKLKSIGIAALAALTFVACSNDDDNGNGITTGNGEAARMSISIKLPADASGARAWDDDVNATTAESTINSVTVYVFNGTNGAAMKDGGFTHFPSVSNSFTESSGVYTLKTSENIKTVSGNAKVYVAANLPAGKAIAYASESLMLAAFDEVENLDNTDTTTGFTMFSEGAAVTLPAYDENNPNTTTGQVTANLDRVVTKLVGSTATASYTESWPSFNDVKFTYEIKGMGVYNEAIESYLAKNTTTLSTLNPFAKSVLKPNASVVNPHPGGESTTAALTGFYIGENTEGAGNATFGYTTYAMVATTVSIDKEGDWDTGNDVVEYTSVAPYGKGSDDVYIVKYQGIDYVTSSQAKASNISNGFATRDGLAPGDEPKIYVYTKGWVHFQVYLNREGTNDYNVGRNEFIHVKVNGVVIGDGQFPGYPGDPTDPEKPIDPTDPLDPNNPDPKDPDENIDPEAASLNIEIAINKWTYKANETILQ